jgi:2-oxoglutarate/2-oxoacid ferredoxin oxidoreductase subunit beta
MTTLEDYGDITTAWCPGCGNFAIRKALIAALVNSGLAPHEVLLVSGIGQAAKMPHYLMCNCFNGLHGRSLPTATGARLANPGLKLICESGDGCSYGEGGNHFLSALRRNVDLTLLVHDNQVYGLTKGQASPTSAEGFVTKAQPQGVHNLPFQPLAMAVMNRIGLVARGFAGDVDGLTSLMQTALATPGLAMVDILQPCVSFNKVNTYAWYRERVFKLEEPLADRYEALKTAELWGEKIPIGVIYRNDAAKCREVKEIFRREALPDEIACQADMTCVMMR